MGLFKKEQRWGSLRPWLDELAAADALL